MTIEGYEQTGRDDADLIVAFGLDGKPRTNMYADRTYGSWYGRTTWYSTDYIQGTLPVDAFDVAKEKLVWHGWGTKAFFEDENDKDAAVKAADRIVAQFPKRSGP